MIIYVLPAPTSPNGFTGILLILMANLLTLMNAKMKRKCLEPPVREVKALCGTTYVLLVVCRKPRLLLIRPEEVPERAVRASCVCRI